MDGTSEKIAQVNALLSGHSNALSHREVSAFDVARIIEAANKIAETITHDQQRYLDESARGAMNKEAQTEGGGDIPLSPHNVSN